MIRWVKTGREVNAEGSTTCYDGVGTPYSIESRKRHIPHANRSGTWDHTSYFVMRDGEEIKERYTLKEAKAYAEELWNGGEGNG